jgi:4-hydroxymandelate oxidase
MSKTPFNRRQALTAFASLLAASPLLRGQDRPQLIGEPAGRLTPNGDFVNSYEYADMAARRLNQETFAAIADGDHAAFDRITFRPRLMVNTKALDLTVDLFGQAQFTPILIGPAAHQKRFHPGGELAMARGAAAAKATLVVAEQSDFPIEQLAQESGADLWYQAYPTADANTTGRRARAAVSVGCKVVCITVGAPSQPAVSWDDLDRIQQAVDAPVVLKGIMSPDEALQAIEHGVAGIIVSNHGARPDQGIAAPITALPSIAETVAGRVPVLIDGGVRRGSDVLKSMALGAAATLIARPALWALAAYGAEGVQSLIEMLQTELGRDMTMLGTVNPAAVTPNHVKLHRR